jgi:hypothetical protein
MVRLNSLYDASRGQSGDSEALSALASRFPYGGIRAKGPIGLAGRVLSLPGAGRQFLA